MVGLSGIVKNNEVSFLTGRFCSMDKKFENLVFCIVGLGLIGGSYAKALRLLGVKKIIAVDSNKDILSQAMDQGVIDTPCVLPDETLKEADVIIFAVYPASIFEFVQKNICDGKRRKNKTCPDYEKYSVAAKTISF